MFARGLWLMVCLLFVFSFAYFSFSKLYIQNFLKYSLFCTVICQYTTRNVVASTDKLFVTSYIVDMSLITLESILGR